MRNRRLITILLILIVVAAVAVGGWFAYQHFHKEKPTAAKPASGAPRLSQAQRDAIPVKTFGNKIVILINESQFGPNEAIIQAGSAVSWQNMETTTHQVVTDDGKTITAATSPVLAQGKTFEFVFPKAGTYTYHDNLHPNMKGTITVE